MRFARNLFTSVLTLLSQLHGRNHHKSVSPIPRRTICSLASILFSSNTGQ